LIPCVFERSSSHPDTHERQRIVGIGPISPVGHPSGNEIRITGPDVPLFVPLSVAALALNHIDKLVGIAVDVFLVGCSGLENRFEENRGAISAILLRLSGSLNLMMRSVRTVLGEMEFTVIP